MYEDSLRWEDLRLFLAVAQEGRAYGEGRC